MLTFCNKGRACKTKRFGKYIAYICKFYRKEKKGKGADGVIYFLKHKEEY